MGKIVYAKLSELIQPLEIKMQVKYVKCFREAVKEGQLDGMPIEKTFELRGATYRDLMTAQDGQFAQWHAQTLKQLELTTMRGAAGIAYEEDVLSGEVDFKAKAEEFRKSLKKKRRRTSKRLKPGEAVVDVESASTRTPAQAAAGSGGEPNDHSSGSTL